MKSASPSSTAVQRKHTSSEQERRLFELAQLLEEVSVLEAQVKGKLEIYVSTKTKQKTILIKKKADKNKRTKTTLTTVDFERIVDDSDSKE